MTAFTVLVVDADERRRAVQIAALRLVGLHAIGVCRLREALALLEGISIDATVVQAQLDPPALSRLGARTALLDLDGSSPPEVAVALVLSLLLPAKHRPPN